MDCTDIRVRIVKETELAYQLVCLEDNKLSPTWLAKSQISWTLLNNKTREGTANIPDWLLDNSGW